MKDIPFTTKLLINLKMRKLTASELGQLLNVTKAAVSNWYVGVALPPVETYLKILAILARTDITDPVIDSKSYKLTVNDYITTVLARKKKYVEDQLSTHQKTRSKSALKKLPRYVPQKIRKNRDF